MEKKPETADRVRGRIESILDWAKAHKLRAGENPAQWRGHPDQLLPKKSKVRKPKHHAAMSYAEVPGFMDALAKRPSINAKALAYTILTAAGTGEVIGAKWSEFDLRAPFGRDLFEKRRRGQAIEVQPMFFNGAFCVRERVRNAWRIRARFTAGVRQARLLPGVVHPHSA